MILNTYLQKLNSNHRPIVFNTILWLAAFIILLFIFAKGETPIIIDYIYTIAFLVVMAIPVSINFYLLMPRFLSQERYFIYALLFIINLVGFALLYNLFFDKLLDILFPNYFFISYLSNTNTYIIYIIFLVATTLFKLAEDWFYFNRNENRVLKLKNQHIQTQLSSLRAQINPHFLFNSLNVIYAMALDKKEHITKAIVELSDVLRYVIYDSDTERVTLKDEIQLLKNYIAFQDYRVQASDVVDLKIDVKNETFKIYPMLLLPLLENAYKYGVDTDKASNAIQIQLTQKASKFTFIISNANKNKNTNLDDSYSGIGLENLQNNLTLVYPKQHLFNIENTKDTFKVSIEIYENQ
ncbi:sensor histidine kinase [Winogradskyella immobilis]|uniref:Histidine kinase n=1 Tax=Winogradskyella immobilis TaxID=2816852 RepID=A0ABS8EMI6_9FLAO|nr:sensor histidine kinase [Winogradskyella immobilis]MCC1484217.1 histidine kinase [Winogradskyella immobilis]MCG0016309.1 sensor histidine kinase [Winogradskyella immobilis]